MRKLEIHRIWKNNENISRISHNIDNALKNVELAILLTVGLISRGILRGFDGTLQFYIRARNFNSYKITEIAKIDKRKNQKNSESQDSGNQVKVVLIFISVPSNYVGPGDYNIVEYQFL